MLVLALFAYRLIASAFVVVMVTMLRMLPMGLFGASSALPQSASILTRRYWSVCCGCEIRALLLRRPDHHL